MGLAQDVLSGIRTAGLAGENHRAPVAKLCQGPTMTSPESQEKIEAAAFRRLVAHLRERNDVQNIDIMNLAGFCRNCVAKWYRAAAEEEGRDMTYDEAREHIYGMPYADWKAKYQR